MFLFLLHLDRGLDVKKEKKGGGDNVCLFCLSFVITYASLLVISLNDVGGHAVISERTC